MKFLILDTKDPYLNLAIEEYFFRYEQDDVFLLWQNSPTVVVGKNQNVYAELNLEAVRERDIRVARRITGGGAVYHDGGNLNFSFLSSERGGGGLDFAYFTAPILAALGEMGIVATLSGRNDLLTDGKKFSGNAQYSANGRTLHHGTLLFDSDLDVLDEVLNVDEEKLRAKAIRSTRSRVTNLKPLLPADVTMADFIEKIAGFVIGRYRPEVLSNPPWNEQIETLRRRNESEAWLYPERGYLSAYQIHKKKRYDFGTVEIRLEMRNEGIEGLKIEGDFFGVEPVEELERRLVGVSFSELAEVISTVRVEQYIFGMTEEELLELIRA